jgi:diacylglycerol kinase
MKISAILNFFTRNTDVKILFLYLAIYVVIFADLLNALW